MRLAKPAAVPQPGYWCSPGLVGGGKVEVMAPHSNKSVDKNETGYHCRGHPEPKPEVLFPLPKQSRKKTNQKETEK